MHTSHVVDDFSYLGTYVSFVLQLGAQNPPIYEPSSMTTIGRRVGYLLYGHRHIAESGDVLCLINHTSGIGPV